MACPDYPAALCAFERRLLSCTVLQDVFLAGPGGVQEAFLVSLRHKCKSAKEPLDQPSVLPAARSSAS